MVASRRKVRIHNPILNILLIFLVLVTFYPLLFTFLTSFKDNNQFFTDFWGLPNRAPGKLPATRSRRLCRI